MTELDQSSNWKHTNIFADGQLLATYDASGLHFPLSDPLGVVCQEVVVIETCSADRRLLVEAGVGTVPVVLVGPGWE